MNESSLDALDAIGIVGCGAAGRTLGRAIAAVGGNVVAVASRTREHAEALAGHIPGCRVLATPSDVAAASDLIILAVPDDAITLLAQEIRWQPGNRVFHLSGASDARRLAAAREQGAVIAALHPLMTFTVAQAENPIEAILARLRGCVWAMETDNDTFRTALFTLVSALGGRAIHLDEKDRVPYHISAVLVANYVVTLMGAAATLWESFAADASLAREALLPLLRASAENLATMEPSAALTGPVARGDLGTLSAHLDWLAAHTNADDKMDALRDAYVALARLAVPLAEAKGTLSPDRAEAIRGLLEEPRKEE
jgi:predicted short-subunit dehydrogenase-like oxidoreductase (DUF2520 family)